MYSSCCFIFPLSFLTKYFPYSPSKFQNPLKYILVSYVRSWVFLFPYPSASVRYGVVCSSVRLSGGKHKLLTASFCPWSTRHLSSAFILHSLHERALGWSVVCGWPPFPVHPEHPLQPFTCSPSSQAGLCLFVCFFLCLLVTSILEAAQLAGCACIFQINLISLYAVSPFYVTVCESFVSFHLFVLSRNVYSCYLKVTTVFHLATQLNTSHKDM